MTIMKKILIPYDFSPNAASTLRYAIPFAEATGAAVVVFHALSISAKIMAAPVTKEERDKVITDEEAAKANNLQVAVSEAITCTSSNISTDAISCQVKFGPIVVESIIEAAEAAKADLIIMGTHGATGLKKVLFGSVTSATISKSDIPVLAIPDGFAFNGVKTVVYASDLENLESELKRILPVIKPLESELDILHFDYARGKQNLVRDILQRYADDVNLVVQKADASIPLLKQVNAYISQVKPDMLAMVTRERSMWSKLFMGSKTEDAASQLQTPLLSLKKDM